MRRTRKSSTILANHSQYMNAQRSEPPQLPDPTAPQAARRVVRSIVQNFFPLDFFPQKFPGQDQENLKIAAAFTG